MEARLESPQGILVSQGPTGVFFASSDDSSDGPCILSGPDPFPRPISPSSLSISHSIRLARFVKQRGLVSGITYELVVGYDSGQPVIRGYSPLPTDPSIRARSLDREKKDRVPRDLGKTGE